MSHISPDLSTEKTPPNVRFLATKKWSENIYLLPSFSYKKIELFFQCQQNCSRCLDFCTHTQKCARLYSCCQTLGNMCYTIGSGCTCFLTAVDAVFRIVDTVDGASCSCLHNPKMWAIPAVASCRAVLAAAMNVVNAAMLLAALLAQHVSCAIPSKACFILGVDAVESNLSWTCWH